MVRYKCINIFYCNISSYYWKLSIFGKRTLYQMELILQDLDLIWCERSSLGGNDIITLEDFFKSSWSVNNGDSPFPRFFIAPRNQNKKRHFLLDRAAYFSMTRLLFNCHLSAFYPSDLLLENLRVFILPWLRIEVLINVEMVYEFFLVIVILIYRRRLVVDRCPIQELPITLHRSSISLTFGDPQ